MIAVTVASCGSRDIQAKTRSLNYGTLLAIKHLVDMLKLSVQSVEKPTWLLLCCG
jgi:hypothetical protein